MTFLRKLFHRDPSASDAARILNEKKQTNRSALIARTNQLCDELGRPRAF